MSILNSLYVHKFQSKYRINVTLVVRIVFSIFSKMIYIGIFKIFLLSNTQHLITISSSQELTLLVKKFKSIPLAWVMRSGDDDTTGCTTHSNSKFGSRSSSQTDVKHIVAHTHQSTTNYIFYHLS